MRGCSVSAVIPAYNEGDRIASTIGALQYGGLLDEIIVVNDGSQDQTAHMARLAGADVISLPRNLGKAAAVRAGFERSRGDIVLLVDADLELSAYSALSLVEPVRHDKADLTIGRLPGGRRRGGIGAVITLARWAVDKEGGGHLRAPLSGQRACRRELLETLPYWGIGFGLEIALTIHCLRRGARILEQDIQAGHRVTGPNFIGFRHRFHQFLHIAGTLRALDRRGRHSP